MKTTRQALLATLMVFLLSDIASSQQLLWSTSFGGRYNEGVGSCLEANDGTYLIAGSTYSFGSGEYDVYLLKLDFTGDTLWSRTFGGPNTDHGYAITQTADSGFVLVGSTSSGSGDSDFYIIRLNNDGQEIWSASYGNAGYDEARAVEVTPDGGLMVVGNTEVVGLGYNDGLLIKLNAAGDSLWSRTFGGLNDEYLYDLKRTPDNNYVIFGSTMSYGEGYSSYYAIKIDAAGDSLWSKTYGGSRADLGRSVQVTAEGGLIFAGRTYSYGQGSGDAYLVKTDADGNVEWENQYGGRLEDRAFAVYPSIDGGYLVVGTTESFGAGGIDIFVVKTDSFGQESWHSTYGGAQADYASGVIQNGNQDYFIAGHSYSYAAGGSDVYVLEIEGDSPTAVEEPGADQLLPQALALSQNYPNPFNATTSIDLALGRPAVVQATIFNILGQAVRRFETATLLVGERVLFWDGRDDMGQPVATGIYFFRVEAGAVSETRKMILMK